MSEKPIWGKIRSLSSVGCFLVISFVLHGQPVVQQNEIRSFITGQIPVGGQNWEISRDPVSGFIYFANSSGLVEYNGITTRTYAVPYIQGVRSVYVNNDGMIFTGSFEDFGYWEKDPFGELTYNSLAGWVKIPRNDEIWNIFELDHKIWFQSFTTIYIYDYNAVRIVSCPGFMLFLFRAGNRFMAQFPDQGLFWFDGIQFTLIEGSKIFSTMNVLAVIEFNDGTFWISTANNGIYTYNGKLFTPLKSEISDYLKQHICNAGLVVNDSIVVFGTILKGVAFSDRKGNIIKTYDYSNGLNNNTVLSLFRDEDYGLWIGLDDGAGYVNMRSPVSSYTDMVGDLRTIYTAIRDGQHLYLGTNHGLFLADIKSDGGSYSFSNLRIMPNTQGQVWSLVQYGGRLLCGHNDGTFTIKGDTLKKISEVTGGWSLKPYGEFLIEGTYTGLISFRKNQKGDWIYNARVAGYTEPTRLLEVDYLGYVWALHPQKGVYRLELNERADSIISTLYFSSVADSSRTISMSSINNQVVFLTPDLIYAFDYEKKNFFAITSLEPGLGEYVSATQIIHFRKNSYWFILENRIALFEITRDLKAEKILEFTHEYADLPLHEQQIISLDSNTLLIPTRQAFSTYDLPILRSMKNKSALTVSRLVFSGGNKSTTLYPFTFGQESIPSKQRNLMVFIANPSGFDREGREYLYRISELGEHWYSTTADNFSFPNLRFGKYHLQVKEQAGENITEAVFTVRKPFYISIGAIILYIVTLAGLVGAGTKIFRSSLERHRRLIEYESGKSRLESELDFKSYELMLTMRYLIRKTDTLREIRDKLDSLKETSAKLPARFVREMEQIIDHGLDTQTEEWQNVMKNLKLSHEGFFRKLKQKYPSLTPNDLRLCSYLRMNFTTKEIANLTNISSRAVEIGRYRLRAKLNLPHDTNLTEFLIREAEDD